MSMKIIAPIAAGVLLALAGAAQAATKSASFTVSASVAKNCVIGATDLGFGTFDGTNALEAQSTITVRCTSNTGYDIDLSAGVASTFATRTMAGGANTLAYNLYRDAGRTQIWGDGTGGSFRVSGTGTGMAAIEELPIPVYGRVDLADLLAAPEGNYSRQITATITY